MSYEPCEVLSARNDGSETCCLHDLPDDNEHAPGRVCCWCGDVFLPHSDSTEHGDYKPGLTNVGEEEFLAEAARGCSNCSRCADVPCGACQAGGICDAFPCRCDSDDEDIHEDETEDDHG